MIRTRAAAFPSQWIPLALIPILVVACFAPWAQSQPAAPATALPTISTEIKNAPDVTSYRASIQAFVDAAAQLLGSKTPEEQTKARIAIRSESMVLGQPKATPAYLGAFTGFLDPALTNLAKSDDMRVRLNAGIVAAGIAETSDNANLAPTALVLTNDKTDAVVLWGVKTARWVIPAQLRAPKPDTKLMDAMLPAVKAHPKGTIGGAIALEAYAALAPDVTNPAMMKKITPAMLSVAIPYVLDLLDFRVSLYRRGVPPDPHAERTGANFLVNRNVWDLESPAQQQRTMQLLSDLVYLAAEQAAAPSINALDVKELVGTIETVIGCISVAAGPGPVADAIAAKFGSPPKIARGTPPAAVQSSVKAIYPAIKEMKQYAGLNPPPAVTGNEAPPPPASAPTTGPVVIPGAMPVPPPSAAPAPGTGGTATTHPAGTPVNPRPGTPPTPPPGAGGTRPGGTTPTNPRPTNPPQNKTGYGK